MNMLITQSPFISKVSFISRVKRGKVKLLVKGKLTEQILLRFHFPFNFLLILGDHINPCLRTRNQKRDLSITE